MTAEKGDGLRWAATIAIILALLALWALLIRAGINVWRTP